MVKLDVYKSFSTNKSIALTGVSSAYIRDKVEKFVDDTNMWLISDSPSPSISFADIPKGYRPEVQKAISQLGKNMKVPTSSDNLSISIGERLTPLKTFYLWTTRGLTALVLAATLCVVGVYFLSETTKESFKGLGSMFLISFFFNILSTGLIFLIQGVLRGLIIESPNLPDILKEVYKTISLPLFQTSLKVNVIGLGVLLAASLIMFVISGRIKKT